MTEHINRVLIFKEDGTGIELKNIAGIRLYDFHEEEIDFETQEPVPGCVMRLETAVDGRWYIRWVADDVPKVSKNYEDNMKVAGFGPFPEEPDAWCPDCGAKHEYVRPGKTQSTCDCHETCPIHGKNKIVYHVPGEFTQIQGYFCAECQSKP